MLTTFCQETEKWEEKARTKSNIEMTGGKLPGPSLMILGTKPLYRARNLYQKKNKQNISNNILALKEEWNFSMCLLKSWQST